MAKKYAFLTLFILTFTFAGAQNKLEKSKSELKSSSKESSSSSKSSSSSSDDDSDIGFLGEVFFNITFGVFKYGLIGDYTHEDHLHSSMTAYPYYNGKSGNYKNWEADTLQQTFGRIDLENKFIYSNNRLFGNHLELKARPFQYFYVQADYRHLFEFNKVQGTSDDLALFHLNLAYDRIRFEKFNVGWNIGASYIGSGVNKAGFSYGLSADYFMTNQISFSASQQWSRINYSPVNALELQGRYHKRNYCFTMGYERLKIAAPVYNFITVGGGIYF